MLQVNAVAAVKQHYTRCVLPGLTVPLKRSQSYLLIALLISIGVFLDAKCSVCFDRYCFYLIAQLPAGYRCCFYRMQWICLPEKKALVLLCLGTELAGCEYKHSGTILSPRLFTCLICKIQQVRFMTVLVWPLKFR